MNFIKSNIIVYWLLVSCSIYAQNTWSALIPYETADVLSTTKDLIKSDDNGFFVLINTWDFGEFAKSILSLYKYDSQGELEWENSYDFGIQGPAASSNAGGVFPRELIQLGNGNLLLTGEYKSPDTSSSFVFLVSSSGDSLNLEPTENLIRDIKLINNQIVGRTINDDVDFYASFIQIDQSGDLLDSINLNDDEISSLITDGSSIFTSYTVVPQIFKKFDTNGNFITERFLSDNQRANIITINELNGVTAFREDLIKFNENLEIVWSIPAEDITDFVDGSIDGVQGMVNLHTSDNGSLIGGDYYNSFVPGQIYLYKFDSNGVKEWGGLYSFDYIPLDHIEKIVEVNNGYILLGGHSETQKIWLIKLNKNGLLTSLAQVPESNNSLKLDCYPNPVLELLSMKFTESFSGEISIYDRTGKQVLKKRLANVQETSIDLSNLVSGTYFVKITNLLLNKYKLKTILKT